MKIKLLFATLLALAGAAINSQAQSTDIVFTASAGYTNGNLNGQNSNWTLGSAGTTTAWQVNTSGGGSATVTSNAPNYASINFALGTRLTNGYSGLVDFSFTVGATNASALNVVAFSVLDSSNIYHGPGFELKAQPGGQFSFDIYNTAALTGGFVGTANFAGSNLGIANANGTGTSANLRFIFTTYPTGVAGTNWTTVLTLSNLTTGLQVSTVVTANWTDAPGQGLASHVNLAAGALNTNTFSGSASVYQIIMGPNYYNLTYNAGANGTISGTTPQTVAYLSSGTAVTAVGNTNYKFSSWSDGVTTATRTDTALVGGTNVTANFIWNYTIPLVIGFPVSAGFTNGNLNGQKNWTGSSWQVNTNGSGAANITNADWTAAKYAMGTLSLTNGYSCSFNFSFILGATNASQVGVLYFLIGDTNNSSKGPALEFKAQPGGQFIFDIYNNAALSGASVSTANFAGSSIGITNGVGTSANLQCSITTTPTGVGGTNWTTVLTVTNLTTGLQVSTTLTENWTDAPGQGLASTIIMNPGALSGLSGSLSVGPISMGPDYYTLTYNAGAGGTISGTTPQTVAYLSSGSAVTAVANANYSFTGWSDGVATATRTDTALVGGTNVTANFAWNYTIPFAFGFSAPEGYINGNLSGQKNWGSTAPTAWQVNTNGNGYATISSTGSFASVTNALGTLSLTNGYSGLVDFSFTVGSAAASALNLVTFGIGDSANSYKGPAFEFKTTATGTFTLDDYNSEALTGSYVSINVGALGTTGGAGTSANLRLSFTTTPTGNGTNWTTLLTLTNLTSGLQVGTLTANWTSAAGQGLASVISMASGALSTLSGSVSVDQFAIGPNYYNLTYNAGTHGTISGTTPQTVAYLRSGTPVTAVANAGYGFSSWSDGVATAARTDTALIGGTTVTAQYTNNNYVLTYNGGTHGTISGTTPQTVAYLSSGSAVTAVAAAGYGFSGWSDGVLTAARTDVALIGGTNVTAQYTNNNYVLTYNAGANGTISGTTPQTVAYLSSGSAVTAVANANYSFTGWSDGVATATRTDTALVGGTNVTANFAWNYTIPIVIGFTVPEGYTNGNVSGQKNWGSTAPAGWLENTNGSGYAIAASNTVNYASVTNALGTPLTNGYSGLVDFYFIVGSAAASQQNIVIFQIQDSANSYKGPAFEFDAQAGGLYSFDIYNNGALTGGYQGTGNFSGSGLGIPTGTGTSENLRFSFTTTPTGNGTNWTTVLTLTNLSTGLQVGTLTKAWTSAPGQGLASVIAMQDGNLSTLNGLVSVDQIAIGSLANSLPSAPAPTATNAVTYNGNGNTGGSAPVDGYSPYTNSATVTVLGAGSLTKTGYTLTNWNTVANGSGTSYATNATFTITSNVTLYAQWTINTYTLTYTAGANGTLSGTTPQTVTYNGNGNTVTAVPSTGYHFTSWSDGVSTAARTDMGIVNNTNVTANFAINTYNIVASAGSHGSISPNGTTVVNYNGSQAYTITPDSLYNVSDVLVDGGSVGAATSYTFSGVTANHTISASFVLACSAPGIVGGIDATTTNLCAGNPVILTLTNATGTSPLVYQWQTNGTAILNATNASYTNSSVSDSWNYACVVTNACGSITSSVVTVTVHPTPATSGISGLTAVIHASTHTYSVDNTAGSSYGWSVPAGASYTGGTNNSISVTFGTTGGTVGVIETNASGCTGSQQTLSVTVTNHAPVANVMTVTRTAGLALIISLSDLATNWNDVDGDTVELTSVNMQTTNGVNLFPLNWSTNLDGSIVTTNAYAYIGYTNSPNVNDQISYGISDGFGGTNIGYVNIVIQGSVTGTNSITAYNFTSPSSNTVTAYGIPNFSYILERSTNLSSPVWVDVQTNQAAPNGVINMVDLFMDLGGVKPSPAFYQLKWQP